MPRNPLAIVALFLALVDGLAVVALSVDRADLSRGQEWMLVSFIVGFPLIVLVAFCFLVTKHHHKLYAPGEFRDERLFAGIVSQISPEEEKAALAAAEDGDAPANDADKESANVVVRPEPAIATATAVPPEVQIATAVTEAERKRAIQLALKQLSVELNAEIKPGGYFFGRLDLRFDGTAVKTGLAYAITIEASRSDRLPLDSLTLARQRTREVRAEMARRRLRGDIEGLFVLVDLGSRDPLVLEKELRAIFERYHQEQCRYYRIGLLEAANADST